MKLQVDAILAVGDLAIRAARQATATIPIVAGSDNLVGEGHVVSLARPGGDVTGVSILAAELNAKRLEVSESCCSHGFAYRRVVGPGHRGVSSPNAPRCGAHTERGAQYSEGPPC